MRERELQLDAGITMQLSEILNTDRQLHAVQLQLQRNYILKSNIFNMNIFVKYV